jgi:hypothetical protein
MAALPPLPLPRVLALPGVRALALRLALLGAFIPLLAGCGGGDTDDAFAPACPNVAIVRDAADLSRFRGSGRDLTDAVLSGRITNIGGACKRDGADTVVTTVQVGIELQRGPAAPGRQAQLAYFVAVLDGERILDKQVFGLRAEFPANADRLRLSGDDVELRLPVRPGKTAAAYRIQVGFQLAPVELEVNRRRGAQ